MASGQGVQPESFADTIQSFLHRFETAVVGAVIKFECLFQIDLGSFALLVTLAEFCEANGVLTFGRFLVPTCLLYTSPSPRDRTRSRMPSSA